MTAPSSTIAVLTENALIALDLTTSIGELFPSAKVVMVPTPLSSIDEIVRLSGLMAVILDQAEARRLDLDGLRGTGASIIVLGDAEENCATDITYLQLPFTTEMFAGVMTRLSPRVSSPEA